MDLKDVTTTIFSSSSTPIINTEFATLIFLVLGGCAVFTISFRVLGLVTQSFEFSGILIFFVYVSLSFSCPKCIRGFHVSSFVDEVPLVFSPLC